MILFKSENTKATTNKYTHLIVPIDEEELLVTVSKVTSEWVPNYDNTHSCRLSCVAPLEDQVAGTMTQYPSHSHHPDTEKTKVCFI